MIKLEKLREKRIVKGEKRFMFDEMKGEIEGILVIIIGERIIVEIM